MIIKAQLGTILKSIGKEILGKTYKVAPKVAIPTLKGVPLNRRIFAQGNEALAQWLIAHPDKAASRLNLFEKISPKKSQQFKTYLQDILKYSKHDGDLMRVGNNLYLPVNGKNLAQRLPYSRPAQMLKYSVADGTYIPYMSESAIDKYYNKAADITTKAIDTATQRSSDALNRIQKKAKYSTYKQYEQKIDRYNKSIIDAQEQLKARLELEKKIREGYQPTVFESLDMKIRPISEIEQLANKPYKSKKSITEYTYDYVFPIYREVPEVRINSKINPDAFGFFDGDAIEIFPRIKDHVFIPNRAPIMSNGVYSPLTMEHVAGHEVEHFIQNLNPRWSDQTKVSNKVRLPNGNFAPEYYVVNPGSAVDEFFPMFKKSREYWYSSPAEFGSEIKGFMNAKGINKSYNQWDPSTQKELQNFLAYKFPQYDLVEIKKTLPVWFRQGFKNGGKFY